MELTQHGLLEEFLAPKGDSWTTLLGGGNEIFPNAWNSESFDHNQHLPTSSSSSILGLISPSESSFVFPFGEPYPFADGFAIPEFASSCDKYDLPAAGIQLQEEYHVEDAQLGLLGNGVCGFKDGTGCCKVEHEHHNATADLSVIGPCGERKIKVKKVDGQPSKNLMAERRRRKRLNDRLSMLRSIVPKISKMDRTSILGDTIDYMKELLDKIQKLREENVEEQRTQIHMMGSFKEIKPNEVLARNPPKFDVERRNLDTRIEICCAPKPGLLLSTVSTLEALGLDIQQCVISSFSDFSVQASCSEVMEHRGIISPEDIKQALFRTAGYGGRCL